MEVQEYFKIKNDPKYFLEYMTDAEIRPHHAYLFEILLGKKFGTPNLMFNFRQSGFSTALCRAALYKGLFADQDTNIVLVAPNHNQLRYHLDILKELLRYSFEVKLVTYTNSTLSSVSFRNIQGYKVTIYLRGLNETDENNRWLSLSGLDIHYLMIDEVGGYPFDDLLEVVSNAYVWRCPFIIGGSMTGEDGDTLTEICKNNVVLPLAWTIMYLNGSMDIANWTDREGMIFKYRSLSRKARAAQFECIAIDGDTYRYDPYVARRKQEERDGRNPTN